MTETHLKDLETDKNTTIGQLEEKKITPTPEEDESKLENKTDEEAGLNEIKETQHIEGEDTGGKNKNQNTS